MSNRKQRCFGIIFVLVLIFLILYNCIVDKKEVIKFSNHSKQLLATKWSENDDSKSKTCENLYNIAKEMLNGSRIALPFNSHRIRWNFQKGVNFDILKEAFLIWNPEGKLSSETREFVKLYNATRSKDLKVKKHFITFADKCCKQSKLKAVMRALYPGGFDTTKIHDLNTLSDRFKQTHNNILSQTRGSGYWLWKPYIILKTLVESMRDGDLLMYQDAGAYLTQDAGPLLKLCQDSKYGILIFYLTLLEQHYTKQDAFILMEMDHSSVYQSFQRLASFVLFQRNCKSLQFVMEWLAYASDPRLITDMENTLGSKNRDGFKGHRHDQSVLSLLSKKWGVLAYRTPSQYGNSLGYVGGPYSQIIEHDRNRS